jgi:hypothetical protein
MPNGIMPWPMPMIIKAWLSKIKSFMLCKDKKKMRYAKFWLGVFKPVAKHPEI